MYSEAGEIYNLLFIIPIIVHGFYNYIAGINFLILIFMSSYLVFSFIIYMVFIDSNNLEKLMSMNHEKYS